jgi:hypothetical protein
MHDGVMAMAPYALLSVASAATSVLFAVAVVLRLRRLHMLIGSAAMALLALWFAGLAVTAGPAPVLVRGQAADLLRWLAAIIAALWFIWLASYSWSLIRIERP